MLFHLHMVHIVKISVFNYRSGCISVGKMISTCIYVYEHIEKNLKDLSRKKKDFSKECTNDKY